MRDAFRHLGHDAISCDLLPTEQPGPHIQGDCLGVLHDGWDLLIAHPPCRFLAISGARWWAQRRKEQEEALAFVQALLDAPIPKIALENPVGCISTRIRPPDQVIQPFEYGEPESKKTCLWLKGLPLLKPTKVLPLPECGHWQNQTPSGQNKLGPSPDRWKARSRTYLGIARAFASQWGALEAANEPMQLEAQCA